MNKKSPTLDIYSNKKYRLITFKVIQVEDQSVPRGKSISNKAKKKTDNRKKYEKKRQTQNRKIHISGGVLKQ